MRKVMIRHQFDAKYKGKPLKDYKEKDGKSLTIPDMNMSIRTMLENHTRGLSNMVAMNKGQFFEDIEVPRYEDILEAREEKKRIADQLREAEAKLKRLNEDKRKKEVEALQKRKRWEKRQEALDKAELGASGGEDSEAPE